MFDRREEAGRTFRRLMAPLLALGDAHPDSSDLFIDGDQIRLSWGYREELYGFDRFPGLTPGKIRAACDAAAVFADEEFGPRPPARPDISVKLPPDLRVTCVMPPMADKWHVTIRFLRSVVRSLEDYVGDGSMTEAQMIELRGMLRHPDPNQRANILVSGATGSGKTTLLRAMLREVCDDERIVIVEDTPELNVQGYNIVHLQKTLHLGMADLIRTTLRLTPKRIVVGEVRGTEAVELIEAMNTGHPGTLCSLHANSAREAIPRLHLQCRKVQPHFPVEEITLAVGAVVQMGLVDGKRRVTDIWRPRATN